MKDETWARWHILIEWATTLGCLFFLLFVLWNGVIATFFCFQNPTANPAAFWLHYGDACAFRRLPQFQEYRP